MKKRIKRIFFGGLLLVLPLCGSAQSDYNPIPTGANFLSIAPDARGAAMGDVGVGTSADIYSQYWNPSKYASLDAKGGVGFSYTPWLNKVISGIGLSSLAGFYRIDNFSAVSSSFRYFSRGNVELTDEMGGALNTVEPYELAFDLAYTRRLSRNFFMGVTLRYVYSDLNMDNSYSTASAFAVDISGYQCFPLTFGSGAKGSISWVFNLSNIGTKLVYRKDEMTSFLPANMRIGTSFDYYFDNDHRVTLNVDFNKLLVQTPPRLNPTDSESVKKYKSYENSSAIGGIFKSFGDAPGGFKEELREITIGGGAEYCFRDMLFARAGYFHENEQKGYRSFTSFGAGVKLGLFQLDGSYLIAKEVSALDQTFRVSLSVMF